jgi:hypothetical protein
VWVCIRCEWVYRSSEAVDVEVWGVTISHRSMVTWWDIVGNLGWPDDVNRHMHMMAYLSRLLYPRRRLHSTSTSITNSLYYSNHQHQHQNTPNNVSIPINHPSIQDHSPTIRRFPPLFRPQAKDSYRERQRDSC